MYKNKLKYILQTRELRSIILFVIKNCRGGSDEKK